MYHYNKTVLIKLSLKTIVPIVTKYHVVPQGVGGTKTYSRDQSHMTNMIVSQYIIKGFTPLRQTQLTHNLDTWYVSW